MHVSATAKQGCSLANELTMAVVSGAEAASRALGCWVVES